MGISFIGTSVSFQLSLQGTLVLEQVKNKKLHIFIWKNLLKDWKTNMKFMTYSKVKRIHQFHFVGDNSHIYIMYSSTYQNDNNRDWIQIFYPTYTSMILHKLLHFHCRIMSPNNVLLMQEFNMLPCPPRSQCSCLGSCQTGDGHPAHNYHQDVLYLLLNWQLQTCNSMACISI